MKVKLIFDSQFVGYSEVTVDVPDDSTNEYIESLFEEEIGVKFDSNCDYIKL